MVNNQTEFNEKFSNKELKEVEIKRNRSFQGELTIENYPDLEKLNLRDIKIIDKVILKKLPQLQEVAIWNCGLQNLTIENCPQIKKLNVRRNSLNNLEFIKDLSNLESLELDGNDKLTELLESYEDGWKAYQENLQKLASSFDLNEENIQELLHLRGENKKLKNNLELSQQKYDDLKRFLKGVLISLSQEAKQELVDKLEREVKRKGSYSQSGRTKELMLNAKAVLESAKEIKKELESELTESKTKIEELKKELFEKNSLYQEKEIELKIKQKEADKLLDKLLEKFAEKSKVTNKLEEDNLQKEIDNLRRKLDISKEREFELKGELKAKREEIERMNKTIEKAIEVPKIQNIQNAVINNYYQQALQEIEQTITQSLIGQEITPQDQTIINQTILFLGVRELFINYRQLVINNLIESYCQLANKSKFTRLTNFNSMMNITSKIAKTISGGGVAETPLGILGDTINLANSLLQEKNSKNYIKKLKEILDQDKKNLSLFDEHYSHLEKTLWRQETSEITKLIVNTLSLFKDKSYPFSTDQNAYKLGQVWESDLPNLNLEQLRNILENLNKSLNDYQQEFQSQKRQLSEQSWFETIEQQTDLLKQVENAETLIEQLPK